MPKPRPINPYVIRNAEGHFFTEMKIVETKEVRLKGDLIGVEDVYRPKFEASEPDDATQFHTEKDAFDLTQNPEYGGPDSFAGCTIEPVWS